MQWKGLIPLVSQQKLDHSCLHSSFFLTICLQCASHTLYLFIHSFIHLLSESLFTCVFMKPLIPWNLTKSISIRSFQTNRSDTVPVGKSSDLVTIWQIRKWKTWSVSFWSHFLQKIFFNLFKVKQNTDAFDSKQTSSQFSILSYFYCIQFNMDFLFVVLVSQTKWLVGSNQLKFNWSSEATSHVIFTSVSEVNLFKYSNVSLFRFSNHFCSGSTDTIQNTTGILMLFMGMRKCSTHCNGKSSGN